VVQSEPEVATKRPMTAGAAAAVHDPDAYTRAFARRSDNDLPFASSGMPADLPVMLDTNFYILRAQNRLPPNIIAFAGTRTVLHSSVALAEISITAGLLDPAHSKTAGVRGSLQSILDAISLTAVASPSPAAWSEAGMLAGILARTQHGLARPKVELNSDQRCCQEGRRRELLNDTLMFLTARESGAILLSANVKDMDLLLRVRPDAHVLLYRQTMSTATGPM
jgi:hypothetical protein